MDPHNFIARAEAQRWIGIAEKLLLTHDLVGSKTFALRARDSDPRLETPNQILTIAETLIASEKRVITHNGSHQHDYYSILQLPQLEHNTQLITDQYRTLAVILNPNNNRFPYSEQAFQLVNDAWAVLSNPIRKSMYDNELHLPHQHQININNSNSNTNLGFDIQQHNFFNVSNSNMANEQQNLHQHNFMSQNEMFREHEQMFQPVQQTVQQPNLGVPQAHFAWQQETLERNGGNGIGEEVENETVDVDVDEDVDEDDAATFWTACPYCLYMFEYPKVYVNCVLRCDHCKRASQAVRVKSPPAIVEGEEKYFYCWGFFPVGVSMTNLEKSENKGNANAKWNPFSPLCDVSSSVKERLKEKANPKKNVRNSGPRVYIDDETDDIFTGVSEPSDDSDHEWNSTKKKKAK